MMLPDEISTVKVECCQEGALDLANTVEVTCCVTLTFSIDSHSRGASTFGGRVQIITI